MILPLVAGLALPAPAPADDLTDLVAALCGVGIEATVDARIDANGGGSGRLAATLDNADPAKIGRLVASANAYFDSIAQHLADSGIRVEPIVLIEGARPAIRVDARAANLAELPPILSERDPVIFSYVDVASLHTLRAIPRTTLTLLSPFLRALTVEVELPAAPVSHNAAAIEGNRLRWTSSFGIPQFEFAWPGGGGR